MKNLLFAAAVAVSALAFAADPPSSEPKKTEQNPAINSPNMGRADDIDAKTAMPQHEPAAAERQRTIAPTKDMSQDAEVLAMLHHDNEMEIQMGQMAKKNGQSKQVKAYGDMLIKDHTLADKQVMQLAKRQNVDLTMPAPKDEMEQAKMDMKMESMTRLQSLKGEEFDREFAKMMVQDHKETIEFVQTTLTSTTGTKVQGLLNKMLPVLKEHLRVAESINKKMQSV